MVQLSKEKQLAENEDIVEKIFYDEMFNMMINVEKEEPLNIDNSYAVFCNLMESKKQREKIAG